MCSHYQPVSDPHTLQTHFAATALEGLSQADTWPGEIGTCIRKNPDHPTVRQAHPATFGLIPHWSREQKIARHTYNARSETVATKPAFRDAWRRAQFCIIPATAIFEPDWRSGRAQAARITRADGQPMGLAGIWAQSTSAEGLPRVSFSMLTINANAHALMRQFHRPEDEKRMVVVLPEASYDTWLNARTVDAPALLNAFPAAALNAHTPTPRTASLF
jgi:putative SOS response-associated peptidase YedK